MGQPSQANTKKLLGRTQLKYLNFVMEGMMKIVLVGCASLALIYVISCIGTRKSFDHLISDSKAPKRPEMESGMTTPPKMRRVAENDYEIGGRLLKDGL